MGAVTLDQPGKQRSAVVKPRRIAAERVFFPAATLYGAAIVPLSVHGMLSGSPLLPGFASVPTHAHELLFGFGIAVMAGVLITRTSRARLGVLFSLGVAASAWSFALLVLLATLLQARPSEGQDSS